MKGCNMARSLAVMKTPADRRVERKEASVKVELPTKPEPTKRSDREGKRAFTAYLYADAYKQLKRMAVDHDTTIQAFLEEAIDLVFVKNGADPIASDASRKRLGLPTSKKE